VDSTPTLPVQAMPEAIDFYTAAGFDVQSYDASFAFVHYEDRSVFDLGLEEGMDTVANRAGCYLVVDDVDGWHRRLSELGYVVGEIAEQPWGMREFALTDPSGNRLRFGRGV